MFYDQFVKLCKERGMSPAAVTREIGLNNSSSTAWKKGSIPKGNTLQKLADYFGVSVDYLLGTEKESKDRQWFSLERKLADVGYSIGFYEEDAYLWINYPDGTLEVTEAELMELNADTDSYLRFKLQELREKHHDRFKPR